MHQTVAIRSKLKSTGTAFLALPITFGRFIKVLA